MKGQRAYPWEHQLHLRTQSQASDAVWGAQLFPITVRVVVFERRGCQAQYVEGQLWGRSGICGSVMVRSLFVGANLRAALAQVEMGLGTAHVLTQQWASQLFCCLGEEWEGLQVPSVRQKIPKYIGVLADVLLSFSCLSTGEEGGMFPPLFQKGLRSLISAVLEEPRMLT